MEDNLWLILIVLVTSFFTVQVSSKALGKFQKDGKCMVAMPVCQLNINWEALHFIKEVEFLKSKNYSENCSG